MRTPERLSFELRQILDQALWLASQKPQNGSAIKSLSEEAAALCGKAFSATRVPVCDRGTLLAYGNIHIAGNTFPIASAFPLDQHQLVTANNASGSVVSELLCSFVFALLRGVSDESLSIRLADLVGLGAEFGPILKLVALPGSPITQKPATTIEELKNMLMHLRAHAESILQDKLQGVFPNVLEYQRAGSPNGRIQHVIAIIRGLPVSKDPQIRGCLQVLLQNGIRAGVYLVVEAPEEEFLANSWHTLSTCRRLQIRGGSGITSSVLGINEKISTEVVLEKVTSSSVEELAERMATEALTRAKSFAYEDFLSAVGTRDPLTTFKASALQCLELFFGVDEAGRACSVNLGKDLTNHVLIAGRSGSGKSNLLHVLIATAARCYPPSELAMHLIDLKQGVEFRSYADPPLRHAKTVVIQGEREACLGVLRMAAREMQLRGDLFRAHGCRNYIEYREAGHLLARILIVIDEFQVAFAEDDEITQECTSIVEKLTREGRGSGLHLVMATQTLFNARLPRAALAGFPVRIALPCDDADSRLILADDNGRGSSLSRPGECIVNRNAGHKDFNQFARIPLLSSQTLARALAFIAGRPSDEEDEGVRPIVYDGSRFVRRSDSPGYSEALELLPQHPDLRLLLGESTMLDGVSSLHLRREPLSNVLIIGGVRDGAAKGLLDTLAQSLAAHLAGTVDEVVVYDPYELLAPEIPWAKCSESEFIHQIRRLKESLSVPKTGATVLLALGIDRAAMLKNEQPFGKQPTPEPACEMLTSLLRSGPENGVHVIAWFGSWHQYLLADPQRRWLKLFDFRVCFSLSQEDSMQALEKPWALGLDQSTAVWRSMRETERHRFRCYLPDVSEE